MARVVVPVLMRDLTGGQAVVSAPGATVGEVIDNLEASYPGIRARLIRGDRLRPDLAVWVNNTRSRRGLLESVSEQSEIRFLLAIAGG